VTSGHSLILAGPAAETTRLLTYWVLAVASVLAALGMVLARRAVHCALLLAIVMLSLAVFYAMEGAPFLAFVQVIVYTGAVLMLFLFVLMIVGITAADSIIETIRGQRAWAITGGVAMFVLLVLTIGNSVLSLGPAGKSSAQFGNANVTSLAHLIFTKYVFPFEITSALLITAAVGAMVLAHRERLRPKPTQREMAAARIAGGHPTPLPGPGTYAQHNAVDMPALLPDGSQSELSVSPVLTGGRPASAGGPPALGESQPDGTPAVTRGTGSAAGSAAGPESGDE
jgi:NADH-quinone oxidoreductase subunit J